MEKYVHLSLARVATHVLKGAISNMRSLSARNDFLRGTDFMEISCISHIVNETAKREMQRNINNEVLNFSFTLKVHERKVNEKR